MSQFICAKIGENPSFSPIFHNFAQMSRFAGYQEIRKQTGNNGSNREIGKVAYWYRFVACLDEKVNITCKCKF